MTQNPSGVSTELNVQSRITWSRQGAQDPPGLPLRPDCSWFRFLLGLGGLPDGLGVLSVRLRLPLDNGGSGFWLGWPALLLGSRAVFVS